MKKIFALIILAVILVSSSPVNAELPTVEAQIASIPHPPYQPYSSPGDYFKVQFDGEGEASVLAELNKLNTGKGRIYTLELEIPGRYVELKYVFQRTGQYWENRFEPLDWKAEQLSKSTKYTVKLDEAIQPGEVGTILLYYKAIGYVNRGVNFDFDFETIKSPADTQHTRVAVSVDPDLYLRGGQAWTDYRTEFVGFGTAAKALTEGEVKTAPAIADYARDVRYASGIVHEKSNLDPWESFHVTGCYNWAGLWFLAYIWEIGSILVFLAAVKFLFWGRIKLFRLRLPRNKFTRAGGMGLVTAVALIVAWWAVFSFMSSVMRWFHWFGPLMLLASVLLLALVLLAPAYWVGRRHGFQEGAWVLVATMVWLFVLLFAMAALSQPIIYI